MGILKSIRRGAVVAVCVGAMTLGLSTAAHAGLTSVNPTNHCGGFKGQVQWSQNPITHAGSIHIWGKLWNDDCHGVVKNYLFVSYHLVPGGSYQFFPIESAGYSRNGNVGVNWYNSKSHMNFSGIAVRVCTSAYGTGCGAPDGV
jgi:hypothetical protein